MRGVITTLAGVVAALAFGGVASAHAPTNGGELLKEEQHRLEQSKKTYNGSAKAARAWNMEVVAHNDLGGRGFNADVWAHEGYAYVGHWGFTDWSSGDNDRFCPQSPNNGVAIVNSRSNRIVGRLQNPDGTSAEDVVVFTARYGAYAGKDIAVAGLQYCQGSRFDLSAQRGIMLWDVTIPSAPKQIGFLQTACCTRGVHEFEVQHRADLRRTFVYATVPTSRYPGDAFPYRDVNGDGDFRLFDITNPERPWQASDWGVQDAGGPWYGGQGCDADANYGHGAEPSDDGRSAFVAYWDSGFVKLDLSRPEAPRMVGRTTYPANADGDAHSSQYDDARKLLFTADEDFCKSSGPAIETGYGYVRVYDYSKPAAPVQVASFRTRNSLGDGSQGSGDFVAHNNFLVGTDVYMAWYSDGVRVVDASDVSNLREVAYFVPPAGQNPVKPSQRGVLSQTTQVWGVVVEDGLVYASDMNTGLWILKRTGR